MVAYRQGGRYQALVDRRKTQIFQSLRSANPSSFSHMGRSATLGTLHCIEIMGRKEPRAAAGHAPSHAEVLLTHPRICRYRLSI
jgi:hypothetical protein